MEAGPLRLRPILMTSTALIFAQIPLMLKLEAGSEVQAPIGWVIFGGMITSTILALLFVPAMYTVIDDLQVWILRGFRRERKPSGDVAGSTSGIEPDTTEEDGMAVTKPAGAGKQIAAGVARMAVLAVAVGGVGLALKIGRAHV